MDCDVEVEMETVDMKFLLAANVLKPIHDGGLSWMGTLGETGT